MLVQLHWQNKYDFSTEFVAQREVKDNDELREFIKETQANWPIVDSDMQWMACNDQSKHFVMTKAN